MNSKILNSEDKEYYNRKLFKVNIWCGIGYVCHEYIVYADCVQTALELAVKYAELKKDAILFDILEIEKIAKDFDENVEEYIDENYIYVDATTQGAKQPWYIINENSSVQEIKEEKRKWKKEK